MRKDTQRRVLGHVVQGGKECWYLRGDQVCATGGKLVQGWTGEECRVEGCFPPVGITRVVDPGEKEKKS